MDERQTAEKILQYIGGKENIASILSCATRIRIVLENENNCDRNSIQELEAVKGIMHKGRELHIVLGSGSVNKIFVQLQQILDNENKKGTDVPHIRQKRSKISAIQGMKHLMKLLGDIFIPIIPAIVAAGLMNGLLGTAGNLWPVLKNVEVYQMLQNITALAFIYLPVLIAVSASGMFGTNSYLGIVLALILMQVDTESHIFTVIIAVKLMAELEKKLHKIVPENIDLFITPLVTLILTGALSWFVLDPVFSIIEEGLLFAARTMICIPVGVGSFLLGLGYAPTVVLGVHHMYSMIEVVMLSDDGLNIWMPIASSANIAQGAAALAVGIKTSDRKLKGAAYPASFSAFLGITEPAMFGVNIRWPRCFLAGCAGGACGAAVAGIMGVGAGAYGVSAVPGFIIIKSHPLGYVIAMVTAFCTAFILSFLLYREKAKKIRISSPVRGGVVPLKDVPDETFANQVLGPGVAVLPEDGEIKAPFQGTVLSVFETGHMIALRSKEGLELLIHVGINTVELKGIHFKTLVQQGDSVRTGDKLLEFDRDALLAAGYNIVTPMVITNSGENQKVMVTAERNVNFGDCVMETVW